MSNVQYHCSELLLLFPHQHCDSYAFYMQHITNTSIILIPWQRLIVSSSQCRAAPSPCLRVLHAIQHFLPRCQQSHPRHQDGEASCSISFYWDRRRICEMSAAFRVGGRRSESLCRKIFEKKRWLEPAVKWSIVVRWLWHKLLNHWHIYSRIVGAPTWERITQFIVKPYL